MSPSARFDVRHLPTEVARPLRRYRRRTALYRFARVLLGTFCVWWLGAMTVAHLDRFLFLDADLRAGLSLGVHAMAAVLGLGWLAMIWIRRPTTAQVAYALESRLASGNEELFVTLDSVTRDTPPQGEHAADLLASLLERSRRAGERIRGAGLVPLRPLSRPVLAVGLAAVVTAALWFAPGYQFPLMAERFLLPGRNLPKPSFIRVEIVPRGVVPSSDSEDPDMVGKGQDVLLEARISGRMPRPVAWLMERLGHSPSRCALAIGARDGGELSFAIDSAAGNEVIRMGRARQDLFVHIRRQVGESFQYQVRCGDAQTRRQTVRMVVQPRVTDVELTTTPPKYSRLPVQALADPRYPDPDQPDHPAAVPLLPGTRAVLHFAADQGECTGSLLIRGTDGAPARVSPEWDPDRQRWRYEIAFDQPQMDLRIVVANRHGFECVSPYDFSLVRREDAPPTVRLVEVEGSIEAVAGELVHIPFEATDDLGLARLAIEQLVGEGREETVRELPLATDPNGAKSISLGAPLDLAMIDARPGQQVRVRICATDTAANAGQSPEVSIRVRSFTRGEDEHDRLRALALFEAVLRLLASHPPSGPSGTLDAETRNAVQALSHEHETDLDPDFGLADLMAILETQQYCAPTSGDRDDLRKLYVQVLAALAEQVQPDEREAEKERGRRLTDLADALGRLIRYRQATNILWRTFGLRYEIRSIRAELVDLVVHGGDSPPSDRVEALSRRVKLYGESLAEVQEDWRSLPGLDAQAVATLVNGLEGSVEDLSFPAAVQRGREGAEAFGRLLEQRKAEEEETAQPRPRRGRTDADAEPLMREDLFTTSSRDRRASQLRDELVARWRERMERKQAVARAAAGPANRIDQACSGLIALGRATLPAALAQRDAGRLSLDDGYRRLLKGVADELGRTGSVQPASAMWLSADSRLLGWSPFAPVLPAFRAATAATGVGAAPRTGPESDALRTLFDPPAKVRKAVADERRALAALELDWRLDNIRRQYRLSDYERCLEFLLVLLADGAGAGLPADERPALEQLVASGDPAKLHAAVWKRQFPYRVALEEIPDFLAFCRDVNSLRDLEREDPKRRPLTGLRSAIQRARQDTPEELSLPGDTYTSLMAIDDDQDARGQQAKPILQLVLDAGEATLAQKQALIDAMNKALHDQRFYGRLSPEHEDALGLSPEVKALSGRGRAEEVLTDVGLGGLPTGQLVQYNRAVVQAVLPQSIRPPVLPPTTEPVLHELPDAVAIQVDFCRSLPTRPAGAQLPSLLTAAEAIGAELDRMSGDAESIDPAMPAGQAEKVRALVGGLDDLLRKQSVVLGCLTGGRQPDGDALLLLELRRQRDSFLDSVRIPLKTINELASADLDAGKLTILSAAVRELARKHTGFVVSLRQVASRTEAQDPNAPANPEASRFALLEAFRFADACLAASATLGSATQKEVKEFRRDHPVLATMRMLREEPAVRWTRELLHRARAVLVQRGRDLMEVPSPGPHDGLRYLHSYGDGYNALIDRAGAVVQESRLKVKAAGDGPFLRQLMRALDHLHGRLNNIHIRNETDRTIHYGPNIIKPKKDADGHWFTERWYLEGRLSILDNDLGVLRDAMQTLRGARAADASARCSFVGGPRTDGPLRRLAEGRRARLRDQAERALAAFAECLADVENRRAPTVLQLDRAQAWLTWYRRLLYSPLSGSGALRATRVEKTDDTDPNLKFLRQEVQKAGRVKTLRNYRDETYQYLQRAEESLK